MVIVTLALPHIPASGVITAAKEGHVNVLELLLQCGADVDAVNKQGDSALVFAATEGHEVRLADLELYA
jgi:ankyrin repeat protein